MRVLAKALVAVLVLLSWVSLTADLCVGDPQAPEHGIIDVDLVNGDQAPVHLFVGGETFPCCQVQAGGSRRASNLDVVEGRSVEFRAGRNGEILATASCRVVRSLSIETTPTVTWTGQGLVCGGTW